MTLDLGSAYPSDPHDSIAENGLELTPRRIWLRLRQYVDGAETLELVLAQLLDLALELEQLQQAGYRLERPVEADSLWLSR